ncbi:SPOR domain-containing protein [Flavobacteriaceae bacterium AU392]|nr:SPOR domain-containing protein [Flavobacteriaceae bacterium]RKM86589.1 SPOR domain-containing protein [Flavobacteriaceae bacterium AU392]
MIKNLFKIIALAVLFLSISIVDANAQGVVTVNQDNDIDRLLALKKSVNKSQFNYTIQIYKGNANNAVKVQSEFREDFTDWSSTIKFDPPNNRKIWVGNFKTRLEADRALVKIKRKYNAAFILKPKKEKIEP